MAKPLDQKPRAGERVLCGELNSPSLWHFAGVTAVLLGRKTARKP